MDPAAVLAAIQSAPAAQQWEPACILLQKLFSSPDSLHAAFWMPTPPQVSGVYVRDCVCVCVCVADCVCVCVCVADCVSMRVCECVCPCLSGCAWLAALPAPRARVGHGVACCSAMPLL